MPRVGHFPAHALLGRQTAFQYLEGLPTPVHVSQLDTLSAQCVAEAVAVCFDGREQFIDRAHAQSHGQTLLHSLRERRDSAPTPALRKGPKGQTGGSARVSQEWLARVGEGTGEFQHQIVPFTVDPSLLNVTYAIREHCQRGAAHSKTLVIDDNLALVTSANLKGSHHSANSRGTPFHDFRRGACGALCGRHRAGFRCQR